MVGKIINVPKPLTKSQDLTLSGLNEKGFEKLTEAQKKTFHNLSNKLNESKTYRLTEAIKNTLTQLAFSNKYGRKIEINSPKLTKGNEVEKAARDILTRVSNIFLTSSIERKTNDWVTGAIDIEPKEVIIDIKSAWSWESFSKILQEKPNEIYLRQGDSYMDLWNKKEFLLCHILLDTPYKLIEGEIRKKDYQNNILDMEGNVREDSIAEVKKTVTNHIFSRKGLEDFCDYSANVYIEWFDDFIEIPEQERVHMISHSFDKTRIAQRNECISLAREFMNTVKPMNNFNPQSIK